MDSDVQTGAPSAPTIQTPGLDVLSSLTPEQRGEWRKTGEIPASKVEPKAESAPAKPAEQAASTDVSKPAASEPAKPHKNAETRKAELDADIQSKLQRRKEVEAELAAAEARLSQMREPRAPETKPAVSSTAPVADPSDPEPDPGTFPDGQFDIGYQKALSRWEARQELRQHLETASKRAQESREAERQQKRVGTYQERINAVLKTDPAFIDGLHQQVRDLKPFSQMKPDERSRAGPLNALADELLDLERPDIGLRYFSDHPDELLRFGRMDVRTFLMEWGKLQAQLAAPAAKPAVSASPSVTEAPEPPTTLGRRPAEPADDVQAAVARGDYRAYRDAMNRKEIGAR